MEAFDASFVMGTRIAREWDASERDVAMSRVQDEQAKAGRRERASAGRAGTSPAAAQAADLRPATGAPPPAA
jgi:hypothetical protein